MNFSVSDQGLRQKRKKEQNKQKEKENVINKQINK